MPLLITELNQKLRGHYAYYGMTFNTRRLNSYYYQTKRLLHNWLNHRGGKRVWSWEKIKKLTEEWMPLAFDNPAQQLMQGKSVADLFLNIISNYRFCDYEIMEGYNCFDIFRRSDIAKDLENYPPHLKEVFRLRHQQENLN